MKIVTLHSFRRANEEATLLWALSSTQYPLLNEAIQNEATAQMIESLGSFALNTRRVLEQLPKSSNFMLMQGRWNWKPMTDMKQEIRMWDALNLIIHSNDLEVGFERLPDEAAHVIGGALVIPYVLCKTDRRQKTYIDPFALSHSFFYQVREVFLKSQGQNGA